MTSIIAFGLSLTALILFLVFKLFERSHAIPTYTSFRKKSDTVVVTAIKNIRSRGNHLEKQLSIKNVANISVHHAASVVARTARDVETRAQDITRKMARTRNGETRTTKSSFFEQVSTHKKNLDTDRVRRETSLTDNTPE